MMDRHLMAVFSLAYRLGVPVGEVAAMDEDIFIHWIAFFGIIDEKARARK